MAVGTKSSYQKKIDELHGQVEEKSKELQALHEGVADAKRRRSELEESIEARGDDFITLNHKLLEAAKGLEKMREKTVREAMKGDAALFKARQGVEKAKELKKQLSLQCKDLRKDIRGLKKEVGVLERAKKGIESAKEQYDALAKEVSLLRIQRAEEREKALDIEKIVDEAMGMISDAMDHIKEYHKHVAFYVRRIVRWYKEGGRPAPKVFADWHPSVPMRKDVVKRLKKMKKHD